MLRVYLDWNVFSRLENNTEEYKKLTQLLSDKDKFMIPYSEAHLADIYRSYKKVGWDGINSHLSKIQKYSDSRFVVYRDDLQFGRKEAQEAMEIYVDAYDNHEDMSFDINEILQPFQAILQPLLNFQIPNPLAAPKEGEDDTLHKQRLAEAPRTSKDVTKLLGEGETTSFGQIMDGILKMSSTIMTDNSYNEMRNNFQKDLKVNTGRLNNKKFDPMEILNEAAQKLQKLDFMELHQDLLINDDITLFKRIVEICRQLDFHGFYPENVKEGHHLDNVETDYNHIAYASTCDYFIVSDKNARAKANMAFDLLSINVKVLTPTEFNEIIENNNSEMTDGNDLINYLFWLTEKQASFTVNGYDYHYVWSFILDYFNLVFHPIGNPKHVTLKKYDSPNRVGVFLVEMETIKNKLVEFFGEPLLEHGEIGNDFYAVSWMTKDLILLKLQFFQSDLTLEVQQCHKLKGMKLFKNKLKNIFRSPKKLFN